MNQQMYHHLPDHELQLIAEYAELLINAKLNSIQQRGDQSDCHLLSD